MTTPSSPQPSSRPGEVQPVAPSSVRTRFRLTPGLDLLNHRAKETTYTHGSTRSCPSRRLFFGIRRRLERWVDRVLPGTLSMSEMAIIRAVHTRTLPWDHYAAQITKDQMLYGMREYYPDGPYILDEDGVPVWTGTSLDPRTERAARTSVHQKGLITTFEIRRVGRRPTRAYMLSTPQVLVELVRRQGEADDETFDAFLELLRQACNPPAGSWYTPREPYHNPAGFGVH